MTLVLLTFLLTTAGYGFLLWLAARRVAEHLREFPDGVAALSEHLFLPVFGRKEPGGATEAETRAPEAEVAREVVGPNGEVKP